MQGSNRENNRTNLNVRQTKQGNSSGGSNNFDENVLRQINRKGKEKSVTFKLPAGGNPDQIMMNENAGGLGSGRQSGPIANVGVAGGVIGHVNSEDVMVNNFDQAEGSNRERASTMDLKSQGGR